MKRRIAGGLRERVFIDFTLIHVRPRFEPQRLLDTRYLDLDGTKTETTSTDLLPTFTES
jgi:hypothetical protein